MDGILSLWKGRVDTDSIVVLFDPTSRFIGR